MATNSPAPSPHRGRTPLWIIAVSLAVIAMCLVVLVIQVLTHKQSVLTTPEDVAQSTSPVNPRPHEDARPERRGGLVVRSHNQPLGAPANTETVAVETNLETRESLVVENRVGGAPIPLEGVAVAAAVNLNGQISGRISLRGQPPPETPINTGGDPYCATVKDPPRTTRRYVVSKSGDLADVLVYLKDAPVPATLTSPKTNWLRFTNCVMEPYISAMTTNQVFVIQNADGRSHAVQMGTHRTPFLTLLNGIVSSASKMKPGLFQSFSCAVHPWEFAYVNVLPNPYFAVTDKDGRFVINDVPPGEYTIEAIHRKAHGTNGITQSVVVDTGMTTKVNFEIRVPVEPKSSVAYSENAR